MSPRNARSIDPEVLSSLHYGSLEEAGREMICRQAESKVSEYRSEVERFEAKHGASYEEFQETVDSSKGQEDFEEEDDLMGWRFARENLRFWSEKVRELKECS